MGGFLSDVLLLFYLYHLTKVFVLMDFSSVYPYLHHLCSSGIGEHGGPSEVYGGIFLSW